MVWLALAALGLLVGAYGALIGAGGGFLLVPVLLLLYPAESPAIITSIALAAVFFNALSGTLAYARLRRIDYRAGWGFALAGIPGAILGALSVGLFSRRIFDPLFAALLIVLAVYLLLRPGSGERGKGQARSPSSGYTRHTLTDAEGNTYSYAYRERPGLLLSAVIGFVSSVLGIGGGIIQVPVMTNLLGFPAHVATATSQFVLVGMSLVGTLTHIASGQFTTGWRRTAALAVGVVVGAQVGAWLSGHIRGRLILRLLALGLLAVGLRLLLSAF